MRQEIIEPEAGVVDSESIRSGKVPVQSIHPRPTTPSTRDVFPTVRERKTVGVG